MTLFGVFFLVPVVIVLFLLAILIFEIAMFLSALKNPSITDNVRILWLIGMLLIHPVVAIVYYFTDYKKTR